jgi:hypothetical protein
MGIRLDWEIEAEREHRQHSADEDPEMQRRRRRTRLRFLLALFILLALIGGAVAAVVFRLRQVEQQTEQVLLDTVAAEVAALRLGNLEAYLGMQRSATDAWLEQQSANFDRYQTLKQNQNVTLSGRIIASQIDGSRGRVQVEEIIDGVPYGRVWFYWRYEDGWRHVPPDYTFWGDAQTFTSDGVTMRYHTVDQAVAEAVAPRIASWLQIGCAALACTTTPELTVEIVPNAGQQAGWSPNDPSVLQLPSPYIDTSRLDMPFDTGSQIAAANLLAERLMGDFTPVYPHDAYYFRQAIISWLVKRFAEVETNSFLISSLAVHYGDSAVGRLRSALQPDSNIGVIGQVTGTSLDTANLDWRDFLTWRLSLEDELITQREEAAFLNLYDTSDMTVRDQAYTRYSSGDPGEPRTVTSVVAQQSSTGTPELRAVVEVSNPQTENSTPAQEEILFRLINGDWKRAS